METLALDDLLLLERRDDLECFDRREYDVWEESLDIVVMVSDGMEIESTGGGCCDCVEAMVEFVIEGLRDLMEGD